MLEMVAAKQDETLGKNDDPIQWMKTTAKAVLRDLSDLGPGDPGTEDKDDNEAWLCHSLIVRLFSSVDSNYEPSQPSNQFKAVLSMQALENCLKVEDMTEKGKSILNETGNRSILGQAGWLSVASTYAALTEVVMADDDMVMDGPRCLATVECSFAAFQAGMLLLSSSGWGSAAEYGDEEQAGAIAHMVGLLKLQCQQLGKRVESKANNPHFRRVDYNLMCCRQQYRFMKERASRQSGSSSSGKAPMVVTCFGTQRKTLRQTVPMDTGDGVVQSVLASHSVRDQRKQLQEDSTVVRPPALGAPIQSRKRAHNDSENNDTPRFALPPVEVSQATRNPGVMKIVGREAHLLLPAAALVRVASASRTVYKARCYRCGRAKVGELGVHPGDGAANKLEYWKVPENERQEGWNVPDGYAIGDTRGKADRKSIRRAWKRLKKEKGIEDEQQFDGWP
jgi:hypothetical protein